VGQRDKELCLSMSGPLKVGGDVGAVLDQKFILQRRGIADKLLFCQLDTLVELRESFVVMTKKLLDGRAHH